MTHAFPIRPCSRVAAIGVSEHSVACYEQEWAQLRVGRRVEDNARLFLAPGMMHCGGGTGPDAFNATLGIPPQPPAYDAKNDLFSALIDWTDKGDAPDHVIATKFASEDAGKIDMQRPLCAYQIGRAHV